MTSRRLESVARQVGPILALGGASSSTDAQLLGRFLADEGTVSALAFEALVGRHGPMVLRVCRGVLRDPHDAQDAFQATFLVLVRKARTIRDRDSLASWLHGVALRVANHSKGAEARRRRLERSAGRLESEPGPEPVDDLGPRLHEEIARLPENQRTAVVLCYLEGLTCDEAAWVLRWPVGTVKSRLSRARGRLRSRLIRLGLAPTSALENPAAPLAPDLARSTALAVSRFGGRSSGPNLGPASVQLAEGVLKMMTVAKLKIAGIALLGGIAGLGIASASLVVARPEPARAVPKPADDPPPKSNPKPEEKPPRPAEVDPLTLMVPRDASATAGSGTIRMYALDAKGERIEEPGVVKGFDVQTGRPVDQIGLVWKEVDVAVHWVAVIATLDNRAIREALARARKAEFSETAPHFKRVDLQRQARSPDGNWSEWEDVANEKNWEILDNVPESTPERAPREFRPMELVDPLPVLKAGTWEGVDPEAILRQPAPSGPDRTHVAPRPSAPRPFAREKDLRPGININPPPDVERRTIHEARLLTIRCLDFTPKPGTTCRYRARVVVYNPDQVVINGRTIKYLFGPWSEPTREVTVP